ncbi:hypothetical protein ABEG17_04105 [Pedococcus sp. KACC 23699]|uniref:Uncharacterized protein n=1 Tax=Pedococcus sp. KACC 23699 TaxID=3149228 RepID=A0AAU7JW84_9MICO
MRRGGWAKVATGLCAVALSACSSPGIDGGATRVATSVTTQVTTTDDCPDVRLAPGAVAASIAFGYDGKPVATGQDAEVRLCLRGFPNKSVIVTAPPGTEVSPAGATTGGTGSDILTFTVSAKSGSGGALGVLLRDSSGHQSADSGGPSVVVEGATWRLAKQP